MSSKKIRFFFSFYKAISYNTCETFPPFLISMYLFNSVRKCMVKCFISNESFWREKSNATPEFFKKEKDQSEILSNYPQQFLKILHFSPSYCKYLLSFKIERRVSFLEYKDIKIINSKTSSACGFSF